MKRYLLTFGLGILLIIINISGVSAASGRQDGSTMHYVRPGETLYIIAEQYGVSQEAIMRQNSLISPDLIYVGQALIIPVGQGPSAGQQHAPDKGRGCATVHVIGYGEALPGIAFDYGVPLQELLRRNHLKFADEGHVGQKLCIPSTRLIIPESIAYLDMMTPERPAPMDHQMNHQAPEPGMPYLHTVAQGETLYSIADRYGLHYLQIMEANNLTNVNVVVGYGLVIPGYQPILAPNPLLDDKPGQTEAVPVQPAPSPKIIYQRPLTPTSSAPESQVLPESSNDNMEEYTIIGDKLWVGKTWVEPDIDGITTLIVGTGNKWGMSVRVRGDGYAVDGASDMLFLGEFGAHRFVIRYLPPGEYDVMIDDPEMPSEVIRVQVGAGQRMQVLFDEGVGFADASMISTDGWTIADWDNPSKPDQNLGGWSNIKVHTPGSGLVVKIQSEGGGYDAACMTGTIGPGACDFAGLKAGTYSIWIDGTKLKVKTYMDGNAYAWFTLAQKPVAAMPVKSQEEVIKVVVDETIDAMSKPMEDANANEAVEELDQPVEDEGDLEDDLDKLIEEATESVGAEDEEAGTDEPAEEGEESSEFNEDVVDEGDGGP